MDVSSKAHEGQQLSQYTVGLLVDLSKGDEDEDVDIDEEVGLLVDLLKGDEDEDVEIDEDVEVDGGVLKQEGLKGDALESQASIGQSHESLDLDKSLSDDIAEAAAVEPLENPQISVPEVDMEENASLRRPKARDFREQLSKKFGKLRTLPTTSRESTGVSRGDSKEASVHRSNGNLDGNREKEVQTSPKRKTVEIELSPSARIKRGKLNADFIPWSAIPPRRSKEENKAKHATPDTRTTKSPPKRKERLKDTESPGMDKTQKVAGKEGENLRGVALIDADVEDEESEQEEPQWRASRKSDGKGKKVSGVKASPQDFEQEEAGIVESEAHKGSDSEGNQDTLEEQQQSAEVGADVAFRSKFGTKDKRKSAHHLSNGGGAVPLAHLNLVWLKVDEEDLWWPAKIVAESEVPLDFAKEVLTVKDSKKKVVSLFHPPKDFEPFRVVKRSCMRPFEQFYESFKSSNCTPEFKRAVSEAYRLFHTHTRILNEGMAAPVTVLSDGGNSTAGGKGDQITVEVPLKGETQMNESIVGDAQILEADTVELEKPAEEEVTQGKVKKKRKSKEVLELTRVNDLRDTSEKSQELASGGAGKKEKLKEITGLTKSVSIIGVSDKARQATPSQTRKKRKSKEILGPTKLTDLEDVNEPAIKVSRSEAGTLPKAKEVLDKPDFSESKETEVSKDQEVGEELPVQTEKLVLDLDILPKKRIVAYDVSAKELEFQDGCVLKIDTKALGQAFNKSSCGLTLHQCIHQAGKESVRKRFPRHGKTSSGLDFEFLDQKSVFANRVRETWRREYPGKEFPKFLKTRFVAACLMEEKGETVNWASDLLRDLSVELREIARGDRSEMTAANLNVISQLLRNQNQMSSQVSESSSPRVLDLPEEVDTAAPRVEEIVPVEDKVDLTEYNHFCQQCTYGGELLCCDGSDCRKTYHLKCLDPPLKEVPTASFFCPSCSQDTPQSPAATPMCPTYEGNVYMEHADGAIRSKVSDEAEVPGESRDTRSEPGVAECAIPMEEDVNVKDFVPEILTEDIPHTRVAEENNLEGQPNKTQIGEVILHPEKLLSSKKSQKLQLGEEIALDSMSDEIANGKHASIEEQPRDSNDQRGTGKDVQVGSLPGHISPRYNRATFSSIQLVNRDERSGSRGETNLLSVVPGSRLLPSRGINKEPVVSELEEGEIAPQRQGEFSVTAEKGKTITSEVTPSNYPVRMVFPELPVTSTVPQEEEGEFPSSDDHNSFCEECEVGGELMLCDGKGCKVVYHKECLEPPLRDVPAGEWFCPQCEMKRKGGIVEKIWAVREGATEPLSNGFPDDKTGEENRKSDTSSPEQIEEAQFGSDDEGSRGLQDMPLSARCKKAPPAEVEELGSELSRRDGQAALLSERTHIKDKGPEYLVQWRCRAHAHNTWVPEKELEKLAPKDLARYKKMLVQGQVEKWNPEWAQPQRVIQKRLPKILTREPVDRKNRNPLSQVPGVEWYVKWKGLGYEHCTWEPVDTGVLSSRRATKLFSAFEKWTEEAKQRATPQSAEQAEKLCNAPLKRLESQPSWVSLGELLSVQLDALNQLRVWWHNHSNGILVYEASQEKIVTTIVFFLSLVEEFRIVHPILVVVPVGLVPTWERELQLWAPKLNMVNYASKIEDARDVVRRMEFSLPNEHFKPQIVLTTFEVINCDMDHLKKLEWEALIIDEGRRLRPQKTYRPFSQLKSVFRLLLLSEPLKTNVEELAQFVGFLEPRKTLLMHGDETTQVAELQRRLSGRVREYMPSNRLTEFWVPVEMTPVHLNQYYEILVKNYPTLSRNRRDHQIQEVVMKLRQSCNHPFLAEPGLEGTLGQGVTAKELLDAHIQMSGKMQLVHLMMPILKSASRRVLIFSQETKQLDILERYMTQSHGTNSYERVDSDLAIKAKEAAIQRFNAEGSERFVFLLKTGAHISLRNVHLAIIYDSDLNHPTNDARAVKKVHIEGEPGSSPLAVLRLYTHLSVEESMLIMSRDKQMPMGRTTVSAKVCQQHLTWGASKICELHDKDAVAAKETQHRSSGAKICPKAKTKRIVYSAEKVQKLLDGAFSQEESAKPELDDLLQEILIPRDETAPLFAESEGHPIDMDTGGSAEAFWTSFFKWRHEEWQAKEVNMLGKGQRGRKRVTYDEDAMASAAYTKAQMADENDKKRSRRRRSSSEECVVEQSTLETIPGPEISFRTPNILVNVMTTGQVTESNTQRSQSQPVKVQSAVEKQKKDLEHVTDHSVAGNVTDISNQMVVERANMPVSATQPMVSCPASVECAVPTNTTAHEEKETTGSRLGGRAEYFLQLEGLLARICRTLDLTEQIEERALELFRHVTTTSKILKRRLEIHESIALELILCWVAADQLHVPLDKRASADKLDREFSVNNDRVQLEGPLLERVQGICSSFQKRPPLRVAPVIAQSASVSESSMPNSRIGEQGFAKSSTHLSTESVQLVMPCQAQVGERPTTGASAECSTPNLILASPQVPPFQKVHVNESAGQVGVSEIPCPDIDVQSVVGEPRSVSEGQVNVLIPGTQLVTPATPQLPLTIISSHATVELGLGWVTHEVTPQLQPAEGLDTATQVGSLSVESTPGLQLSDEVVVAGVGPPQAAIGQTETDSVVERVPEMASVSAPVLASPVAPTGPQAAPKQVPSGGGEQAINPHVQARSDTAAELATKLREDRALVIRAQTEEMGQFNQRLNREGNELKDQFDKACRVLRTTHDTPGPMIESRKALHDIDVRALDRRRNEEHKAMEARQRGDRDKLTELFRRQIDQVQRTDGIPPDGSTLVSQINSIKQFYSKFLTPPSPQARAQEPTRTYVTPQPIASSQSPSMRGQPDGRSSVSQSLSPAQIAELRQRLHPLLVPRTVPASASPVQVSSTAMQQRAHPVRNMPGHGVGQMAAGQTPQTQHFTGMGLVAGQPSIDHFQRHSVATTNSTFNIHRGVSSMSRGPFISSGVPTIAPAVATSSRIPVAAPAGPGPNAQSPAYVYPDVLLKEKEKLSKELERAKILYEAESQRIKAEYDKEAEALHKKYETLLVEEHRAFTTRQQQVQQNIIKVEWNRQLAEALKLREELASRAGMLAAAPPPTNSSMTAHPYLRAQQPQPNQSPARPMQGVPSMTPSANLQPSRGNMHNNSQFLPAGTQGMMTGYSLLQVSSRTPSAPTNQPSPILRVETSTVTLNQQPRAPLSQTAHAVLAEALQRSIGLPPGTTIAGTSMPPPSSPHPVERPRIPNMSVPAKETNVESNPSPRQQTTGTSTRVLEGTTSISAPSFSDPILSVIRNSLPPTMSAFAGLSSSSPRDASTTGAVASTSASPSFFAPKESSLPDTGVTRNQTQPAGSEPPNSVDLPSLLSSRGDTSLAQGVPIEGPTSDPAIIKDSRVQTRAARAPLRETPASVIYLSDSDDN